MPLLTRWLSRLPKKTVLVGSFLFGIIIGLLVAGHWIAVSWLPTALIISLALSIWRPWIACLTVCLIGFSLGWWRGQSFDSKVDRYKSLYETKIEAVGVVADDVAVSEKGETEFHINDIHLTNGETLPGQIRVRLRGEVMLGRGDVVQVRGKLHQTAGTSRQGSLPFAEIKRLSENKSVLEDVRNKFFAIISQIIPEPQASLGLGYLIGLRVSIPTDLEEALSTTGLTHIVAVSGYNLTVIVFASRRLLARRSAFHAVAFSGVLIAAFLVMAGWSAPLSRAAIIASISLLAWYYGRVISPIILLLISGAATGFITPFYVWGDVSWYLSFLAFFGVLVFAPLVARRLYGGRDPGVASQILIETLSAQLFAVPYIMFLFGTFSVVAPLANLLVLPPTPLIMLGIFLTGVIGLMAPFVASLVAVIPHLLLTLQIWLIEVLSSFSWAASTLSISLSTMLGLYSLILLLTAILWHAERQRLIKAGTPAKIDWNMV